MNDMMVDKESDSTCNICLENTGTAEIMCEGKHYYCIDCLNNMYETNLIDNKKIENICYLCKKPYFENKLDAMLKEEIKVELTKKDIFRVIILPPNLSFMTCPICPKNSAGMFLIDETDYIQFYDCGKCDKRACLYCLEECKNKANHVNCNKFQKVCNALEKLSATAYVSKCSECKKLQKSTNYEPPSMKDQNCTHIACPKCNSTSCYFCSGHVDHVDKCPNSSEDPIFMHNVSWQTNKKRCPLYVGYLNEIYKDWPSDNFSANVKFFDYRVRIYLKKIIDKYGRQTVIDTYNHFKGKRLKNIPNDAIEFDYKDFKTYPKIDDKILQFFNIN
jgi:hypothetical protein